MPILVWRESQYTLPGAAQDIGDVYAAVAQALQQHGYSNVQNKGYVVADKDGLVVEVHFLFCSGRSFWQVVACATAGPQAVADADVGDVLTAIAGLKFL